jgi:thymidylate kinase
MMTKKAVLIAITGPDGTGKSTIIEKLLSEKSLSIKGRAVSCSVWDTFNDSGFFKDKSQIEGYLKKLQGQSRLLFIAHALEHALAKAAGSGAAAIFIDGHIYKYAVNELARGANLREVERVIDVFHKPDLTIFLDINADAAVSRKIKVSDYESAGDFAKFQTSMQPFWKTLELTYGPWTHIDGAQSLDNVAKQTVSAVSKTLKEHSK